ncbi:unnamed protein product [Microthlaspi erraticum]|uniref:Uncharacterized protein n=1 Tax=Microthlaspi erraticum TaxID=1685480 RepID=A0A6D2HD86_9BRAS|nr:unnamed protein product [Microthlaspi erraticum]
MTLFELPSAPSTRSLFTRVFSGQSLSLVVTATGSMELVRTELSILSFNPPKTQAFSPVLSHLRVSLLPALPKLPPEPPDLRSHCLFLAYLQLGDPEPHSHHPHPLPLTEYHQSPPSAIVVAGLVLCSGILSDLRPLQYNSQSLFGPDLLWFWPILSSMDCCCTPALGLGPFPCYSWCPFSPSKAQGLWFSFHLQTVLDLVGISCSLDESSFTAPFIFTILSSIIPQSFGHLKLSVLLLAGEGTSGSWIPAIVNLHILYRCCIFLDFVHVLPTTSSVLKKSLSRKLFSTCFKDSRTEVAAQFDSKVSQLRESVRRPNAGMFSALLVWELFNISTSSVGMESSLPPSSLYRERTLPPFPFSMRSGCFSDSHPSKFYNLLTFLLSFVSVYMESEDATGIDSSNFGGRSSVLTSLLISLMIVTRLQKSGQAVMYLPTRLSSAYNLLSHEDLSIFCFVFLMMYGSIQRGWLIPSALCNPKA